MILKGRGFDDVIVKKWGFLKLRWSQLSFISSSKVEINPNFSNERNNVNIRFLVGWAPVLKMWENEELTHP